MSDNGLDGVENATHNTFAKQTGNGRGKYPGLHFQLRQAHYHS
jgi:hypothetical protein